MSLSTHWGSSGFANTDLDLQLKQHGVRRIILIGMIANTCIESTGRFGAGVPAGVDGALRLADELRGDEAAQAIQLHMVYAPEPPFGEDPGAVDDYAFVDGDRAKIWQVKRRPVRRRAASLEQASRATEQGARAYGENAARACRLPPDPAQHFGVFHQGLLAKAARHMKDIQRRRIGQGRIRRKP